MKNVNWTKHTCTAHVNHRYVLVIIHCYAMRSSELSWSWAMWAKINDQTFSSVGLKMETSTVVQALSYYDLPLCLTATPHGLFTTLIVLIGVPRYFIMVTLMDFLWIPLHFDVQLVPPSTGGYIADFILVPLDIFTPQYQISHLIANSWISYSVHMFLCTLHLRTSAYKIAMALSPMSINHC